MRRRLSNQQHVVKITSPSSGTASGAEAETPPEERTCTLYTNLILLAILSVVAFLLHVLSLFRNGPFARDELLDDNALDLTKAYHLLPQNGRGGNGTASFSFMPGRFPRLGSKAFRKQCSWTATPANAHRNCTVFMTPRPDGHEGISYWTTEVVMSYMLARMAHCQLYIDYGPSVAIHDVLIPSTDFVTPDNVLLDDWRVPDGFECRKEDKCITEHFSTSFPPKSMFDKPPDMLKSPDVAIGPIPRYRFSLQHETGRLWQDQYIQTSALLPGFALETGMACSLGSLFHLNPDAAKYDNDGRLFAEILPMLRNNPVVALYIRTGMAEHHHKNVNYTNTEEDTQNLPTLDEIIDASIRAALELERKYLAGELELGGYASSNTAKPLPREEISTFVWLVITDNRQVKERIIEEYNEKSIGTRLLEAQSENAAETKPQQPVITGDMPYVRKRPKVTVGGTKVEKTAVKSGTDITRRVLVTSARGRHTRLQDGVSTADFAEALIDWYLIGESDAVVASSMHSFGVTAALRTARHVYDPLKYNPGEDIKPEQLVYGGTSAMAGNMGGSVTKALSTFCFQNKGFKGQINLQGFKYAMDCTDVRRRLDSGGRAYANFIVSLLPGASHCSSI